MSEKLMTLRELAEYLGLSEEKVTSLVDNKVITAYKLGGELLRFRKEQIDATREEIDARVAPDDVVDPSPKVSSREKRLKVHRVPSGDATVGGNFADFLYFYDFYIVAALLALMLLVIIFRG